jgi:hypothetical protein
MPFPRLARRLPRRWTVAPEVSLPGTGSGGAAGETVGTLNDTVNNALGGVNNTVNGLLGQ